MKKVFALLLVAVTLFGVALPAMAYTQNVATSASTRYNIGIYMVEYNDSASVLSGYLKQKPVNRAYTKNEVVAVIGHITVPANDNAFLEGYYQLQFTAKNITFNVVENMISSGRAALNTTVPTANWDVNGWLVEEENTRLRVELADHASARIPGIPYNTLPVVSGKRTYYWLAFGKVVQDNAKITFSLTKQIDFINLTPAAAWMGTGAFGANAAAGFTQDNAAKYLVLNDDYLVFKTASGNYIVYENAERGGYRPTGLPSGDPLFRIEVGRNNRTERLYMYTNGNSGPVYRIHVEPSNKELIFICTGTTVRRYKADDQIKITNKAYKALRRFYDEYFEDDLGLSAYNEGNTMAERDWSKLAGKLSLSATVELEPWVAYPTR